VRRKVPVLCNLKPSGSYVATDFHAVGGVRSAEDAACARLVHGECLTITGRTLAKARERAEEPEPARTSSVLEQSV